MASTTDSEKVTSSSATDVAKSSQVRIESSEGKVFSLTPQVLNEMKVLAKECEDGSDAAGDVTKKYEKFNTTVLTKVITFCTYHATKEPMNKIRMPLRSLEMKDNVQEWYATFINGCEQPLLFELITAANDLGVAPLMTLASAKVAALMRQMPPAQMYQMMAAMGAAMKQQAGAGGGMGGMGGMGGGMF